MTRPLRVFLVDDEPLALRRLARMLDETGRVEIVGSATIPEDAVEFLNAEPVDVVFLDIEMPGWSGFDVIARLDRQPFIVFTTAYDQYALRAFSVNSIDYLLKPVSRADLDRALTKLERLALPDAGEAARTHLEAQAEALLAHFAARAQVRNEYPTRIASRIGERVVFVELETVTHFLAEDKLTFAVTGEKRFVVDSPIADLERKLDPKRFFRIHRSTLVHAAFVAEMENGLGGGAFIRLRDAGRTVLQVARDRVRPLRQWLGG
jgi:two-component system, LytTR family, response regulator